MAGRTRLSHGLFLFRRREALCQQQVDVSGTGSHPGVRREKHGHSPLRGDLGGFEPQISGFMGATGRSEPAHAGRQPLQRPGRRTGGVKRGFLRRPRRVGQGRDLHQEAQNDGQSLLLTPKNRVKSSYCVTKTSQ